LNALFTAYETSFTMNPNLDSANQIPHLSLKG